MQRLKRTIIYGSAFLFPPLMIGTLITFSNLSSLMLHKTPTAVEESVQKPPAPPALTGKPRAAILVSNEGTQITDLMGAYQILAESEAFDVFTVAPKRVLSPTTGAVDILPHYSFENAPQADLLVIPAVLDPNTPELSKWIAERAKDTKHTKNILSLCEGARVAAQSGILDGKRVTSHFLALPQLEKTHPSIHWTPGVRYIEDGNVISSAGVTASLDATLFAIERIAGRKTAEATAHKIHYVWNQEASAHSALKLSEGAQIFLRSGYGWIKNRLGVLLYPGVHEMSLAAALDIFARTQDYQVFTIAPTRRYYRTANGLDLVPSESVAEMFPADLLLVPGDAQSLLNRGPALLKDPAVERWVQDRKVSVKSLAEIPPGRAYDQDLSLLTDLQGPRITQFVARLMEYPHLPVSTQDLKDTRGWLLDWPPALWIKPILIGVLSLLAAAWVEKRFRRAMEQGKRV